MQLWPLGKEYSLKTTTTTTDDVTTSDRLFQVCDATTHREGAVTDGGQTRR